MPMFIRLGFSERLDTLFGMGFRGLYRGILPEYYKVVPGVGIMFMTYEIIKNLFSDTLCLELW